MPVVNKMKRSDWLKQSCEIQTYAYYLISQESHLHPLRYYIAPLPLHYIIKMINVIHVKRLKAGSMYWFDWNYGSYLGLT